MVEEKDSIFKKDPILLVDDDPDDRMLVQDAVKESQLSHQLICVEDGEELMDYLFHRNKYTDESFAPRPGLILLDLNMPKKDGREVLKEIKNNSSLCQIPIVILTTSRAEEDISITYSMGASSYIVKPITFDDLVEVIKTLGKYWLDIVELPLERSGN